MADVGSNPIVGANTLISKSKGYVMETVDPIYAIAELRKLGYNHFVGAFGQITEDGTVDTYHVVGYRESPTVDDINSLIEELRTDEEFSMEHMQYNVDYVLVKFDESFFE